MKTIRTTDRKYEDMLEVLPPAAMNNNGEIAGFLVGEPTTHDRNGNALYASYFSNYPVAMAPDGAASYWSGPNMSRSEFLAFAKTADIDSLEADETIPDDVQAELDIIDNYGTAGRDAALACDIPLDRFDDAFVGQFDSDEDFARDMAEQTGALDKDAKWPMNCIDWEYAARELMYDYSSYSSSDGYYFSHNY